MNSHQSSSYPMVSASEGLARVLAIGIDDGGKSEAIVYNRPYKEDPVVHEGLVQPPSR